MRIDMHTHIKSDMLGRICRETVEKYRENGIDKIVLIEPIDVCLAAAEKFPDFIIPIALINMNIATEYEIIEYIEKGAYGIKFIAPEAPYGDEQFWPLYRVLEQLNKPAIFHTGYLTLNFPYFKWNAQNIEFMRASQIDIIARRFPNLKILMAHFSNPWWEEAWKISFSNLNVYSDLSGGTAFIRSLDMWTEILAPNGEFLKASFDRLCFGSDMHYFIEGNMPFISHLEFYERLFDRINLPESYREKVNWKNAAEFLGILS